MKKSELNALIDEAVEKRIRAILPVLLGEVFKGMAETALTESPAPKKTAMITEAADATAARAAIRNKFESVTGLSRDIFKGAAAAPQVITPGTVSFTTNDVIMATDVENGLQRPIPITALPDSLQKALTRNYSSVMNDPVMKGK